MQRVFVLSSSEEPLMPCHPARARELLCDGKAAVYRRIPFTIVLKHRADGDVQPIELKVDPGSKTTGIALVGEFKRGRRVVSSPLTFPTVAKRSGTLLRLAGLCGDRGGRESQDIELRGF